MVSYGGIKTDRREGKGKWPCDVCKKGFGKNSINLYTLLETGP